MSTPAPGWYPDPAGSPKYRYWDGQDWTNQLRGREQSPPQQQAPATQQAAGQNPQQARRHAPQQPQQTFDRGRAAPRQPAPRQPTPSWDNAPQKSSTPPVSSAPGVADIPTVGSPQMAAASPGAPIQTAQRGATGYGRRFLGHVMSSAPFLLVVILGWLLPEGPVQLLVYAIFLAALGMHLKGLADRGKGFHFGHYTIGSVVIGDDDTPGIGWGKAVLREIVLKPVGSVFLGAGAVWVFFDSGNRALWDVILGTRVVDVAGFGDQMKDRRWFQAVLDQTR